MRKTFVLLFLIFVSAQIANAKVLYMASGVGHTSTAGSCTPTAETTQASGGVGADLTSYSIGQTFTLTDTDIYSIKVKNFSGTGNLTMYLDTDTNLSDTSFSPVGPVDCSSGTCEFVFNLTGLTPGTYCFGFAKVAGSPNIERSSTNPYADGQYRYATSGLDLVSSLNVDLYFEIMTCSGY